MAEMIKEATGLLKKGVRYIEVLDYFEIATGSSVRAAWVTNQALRVLKGGVSIC